MFINIIEYNKQYYMINYINIIKYILCDNYGGCKEKTGDTKTKLARTSQRNPKNHL